MFKRLRTMCWTCFGCGSVRERERIPNDQLTPEQNALRLVEGGYYYRPICVVCPTCKGSGKRK